MFAKVSLSGFVIASLMVICFSAVTAQEKNTVSGTPLMWESVSIPQRNLYWGAGGQQMYPVMDGMTLITRQTGGTNLKFRLRDKEGREWVAKVTDEAQPEVVANRLLWAIGYPTEVDYIVPKVEIPKWGRFKNVRFEARPDGVKRGDRWSWDDNPFKDSDEFAGLRILMAMLNNWDLKDENTVIFLKNGKSYYAVSDLGASFGKLPKQLGTKSGRTIGKPADYAGSGFISRVDGQMIHFAYTAPRADLMRGLNVTHGRWLADLLTQLSDDQIKDAFRAANYEQDEIAALADSFKARIAELDRHTQSIVAEN